MKQLALLALADAEVDLLTRFANRTDRVCHVDVDAALEVPHDVELPLFRVLQEALTNIVRHAEARTAIVTLSLEDEALQLVVEDDGRGVVEKSAQSSGLGLVGMRERLVDFGGIVTLTDRPAVNGARLIARVPWPVTRLEVR